MNRVKTVLFLGLLTGVLVAIGGAVGGSQGMVIALVIAAAMNFFSYWYSDKMVLKFYRARPVDMASAPELYSLVRELSGRAGLPMPRVCIIDDPTPNAFATGRNPDNAVVAVTTGILRILDQRELRGVLSHELAHVKDRDILISSVAATLAGAVMVLANIARFSLFFGGTDDDDDSGLGIIGVILISILAPLAAMLVQMAVSRSREYLADAEGAKISGDPRGLSSALARLENANRAQPMAHATPQTAHMFIVNPLSAQGMANLFSTHPPISERITRLNNMAPGGGADYRPQKEAGNRVQDRIVTPPPPPPSGDARGMGGKIDWS
ncbi:zinc metalloprotease HtpX [Dethiosulfatarculus sandiegensis]|uniref:Protease HtpX homolog n=1 Tax=Dethiosulfatarculus sandiegensis TaxID=1429043 RepID=A0A0D2GC86_9BACT|nr:zinc metalloprotease HtpX [Dethiosulfatarculus sandiegensis]KIX12487.1 protease [Dethiosulfatarculus sandiegensis]